MKSITFNTPASNRAVDRAMGLIPGSWSCAASLGSKRRSVHGKIKDEDVESVVARLKALKCTSIKITDNDH